MRAALGRGCNLCPAGRRGERPLYGPPTFQMQLNVRVWRAANEVGSS